MIRKLMIPALLAGLLGGCVTDSYSYREDGGGGYYYGQPSVQYNYYDYGYGYGWPYYGSPFYSGPFYGWNHFDRHWGYYGFPFRHYGYPYPHYRHHRKPRPPSDGNPSPPDEIAPPGSEDPVAGPAWRNQDSRGGMGRPRVAHPDPADRVEPRLRERPDVQMPRPRIEEPRAERPPEPRAMPRPERRVAPSLPPTRSEPRRRSTGGTRESDQ